MTAQLTTHTLRNCSEAVLLIVSPCFGQSAFSLAESHRERNYNGDSVGVRIVNSSHSLTACDVIVIVAGTQSRDYGHCASRDEPCVIVATVRRCVRRTLAHQSGRCYSVAALTSLAPKMGLTSALIHNSAEPVGPGVNPCSEGNAMRKHRLVLACAVVVMGSIGLVRQDASAATAATFGCPVAECVQECPIDLLGACRDRNCEPTATNCMIFGQCDEGGLLYCGS